MKKYIFGGVIALGAIVVIVSQAQSNPPFGPVNGPGNNYLPASSTPAAWQMIAPSVEPAIGSTCYTPNVLLFDPASTNAFMCASLKGTYQAQGTWQYWSNNGAGFINGYSNIGALASASTIAPTTQYVKVSGTTTIATITAPTGIKNGAELYLQFTSAQSTSQLATSGNILGGPLPYAVPAGGLVRLIYDSVTPTWRVVY